MFQSDISSEQISQTVTDESESQDCLSTCDISNQDIEHQFTCKTCSKNFDLKWKLTRHENQSHSGSYYWQRNKFKSNYVCKVCDLVCVTNYQFKHHFLKRHIVPVLEDSYKTSFDKLVDLNTIRQKQTQVFYHIKRVMNGHLSNFTDDLFTLHAHDLTWLDQNENQKHMWELSQILKSKECIPITLLW